MNFITGSRAYGVPHTGSDVDLVVLVDQNTYCQLRDQADTIRSADEYDERDIATLYFGRLNLICVGDEGMFEVWRKATEFLKTKSPVSRQKAMDYMEAKRMRYRKESGKNDAM